MQHKSRSKSSFSILLYNVYHYIAARKQGVVIKLTAVARFTGMWTVLPYLVVRAFSGTCRHYAIYFGVHATVWGKISIHYYLKGLLNSYREQ